MHQRVDEALFFRLHYRAHLTLDQEGTASPASASCPSFQSHRSVYLSDKENGTDEPGLVGSPCAAKALQSGFFLHRELDLHVPLVLALVNRKHRPSFDR